jgi:hypothetical protein
MTVMSFYLAKSRKVQLSLQAQKGKKKGEAEMRMEK